MGSPEQLSRAGAPAAQPRALGPTAAWGVLVASTLARAGLAVLALLLLWALLPAAFGMRSTVVMTGSMTPAVQVGDVVVARAVPPDLLQMGSVLLVEDPDQVGQLRLHRFVGMEGGLLRLRGDANADVDSSPIRPEAVLGVGFLRVPLVGMPLVWARSGDWAPVGLTAIVLAAMLLGAGAGRMLPGDASVIESAAARTRTVRGAGAAGAVLVLLAAVGGHAATPAWAAFSSTSPTPSSSFSTSTFPCLRTIGATAVTPAPTVAYAFAETSGSTTEDLTGQGGTGNMTGSYELVPGSCALNDRPAVRLGGKAPAAATPGTVTDKVSLAGMTTYTVSLWFKADRAGGVLTGFGSKADGSPSGTYDRQLLLNSNGTLTYQVGVLAGITASVTTSGNLVDGAWHHAAVTLTSPLSGLGPVKVYVDGVLATSASLSLSLSSSTPYLRFGYDAVPGSTANAYQGLMTGTALWSGVALTDTQIKAISDAGH